MSNEARREMGFLLRLLQEGESISLPHSRPLPVVGRGCHELRVTDKNKTWRLYYSIQSEAIVILDVGEKKTQKASKGTIELCRTRLKSYEKTETQKSDSDESKRQMG
jgi:phage-related protein